MKNISSVHLLFPEPDYNNLRERIKATLGQEIIITHSRR
jgi:hypothetical protein